MPDYKCKRCGQYTEDKYCAECQQDIADMEYERIRDEKLLESPPDITWENPDEKNR